MDWRGFIKNLRRELGINTRDFGDLVGISSRTVEDWEQGRRNPSRAAQKALLRLHADMVRKQCLSREPGVGLHTIREDLGIKYIYEFRPPLGEFAPRDTDPHEWSLVRYPVRLGPDWAERFDHTSCEWISQDPPIS